MYVIRQSCSQGFSLENLLGGGGGGVASPNIAAKRPRNVSGFLEI